ncbi:hypothetical protein D0T53_01445 [Dysgonomonas sp. 216]|nr:hypothetical protein [Dysgonomonas sp. 216]
MAVCLLFPAVSHADTWTVFNNNPFVEAGTVSPLSDFTTKNPSEVEPWAYKGFNSVSKTYTDFSYIANGKAGSEGSWAFKVGDWYYLSTKGRVHMKSSAERPAVQFTAPADGYYVADVEARREKYNNGNWQTRKAQVWAYFNFIASGSTIVSSMGFDLEVATDAIYNNEGNEGYFATKSQQMYFYAKQGDVVSFEIGSASSDTGNGGSIWDKLQISDTDEETAKANPLFYNPYGSSSAVDITAYQTAYDAAASMVTIMQAYDSDLDNLKAANDKDYGKFDASKIDILKAVGTTYTRDLYTEGDDRATVLASTGLLESVVKLNREFYIGDVVSNLSYGWYKVKIATGEYLTYSNGNKFLENENSDNQIWYLSRPNGVSGRYGLFSYSQSKIGIEHKMVGNGAGFMQLNPSGTVDSKTAYITQYGGGTPPTISGIAGDGNILYGSLIDNRDLNYRIIFEPLANFAKEVTDMTDGEYNLKFNGVDAVIDEVTITDNKVRISDIDYALTRYGSTEPYTYAIGTNDTNGYLISASLNKATGVDAVPYAGFSLTLLNPTGVEVIESNDAVVKVEYYNMQGVKVQPEEQGIYIVKKTYESQKTKTEKVIKK